MTTDKLPSIPPDSSCIKGQPPGEDEEILFTIGPYQILSALGKGGMGEVFLAFDTRCGRRIALKRMRADLSNNATLLRRFLQEARLTSQLSHPAIVPIYAIHIGTDSLFYTMPYVKGRTLKQILRGTKQRQKAGLPPLPEGSIPAMLRIYHAVCQAIAFAHSQGVLHRDLKPENVVVGEFGEVRLLDWGLAKLLEATEEETEEPLPNTPPGLTKIGKVAGTVRYMAPERALGSSASYQTDIYSLGVMLYEILSLHPPFERGTLKEFRKSYEREILRDPAELAPYREVPQELAQLSKRCIEPDPKMRTQSMQELLHDLEIYLEGRSEWVLQEGLDKNDREQWEFQEHVLLADHVELTRNSEASDWYHLMVSATSFPEHVKIEAKVTFGPSTSGLGFLLAIPEAAQRKHISDGYCLWIGSKAYPDTKLLRSAVEVMSAPEIFLSPDTTYQIRIERRDGHIEFYIDDQLQRIYISHLPLKGTHVGLLYKDLDFTIDEMKIYSGSPSLQVSCLAVPDALLARKDHKSALSEYQRIAYSFPGRTEGRQARFSAGITLLEQAKASEEEVERATLFERALEEFSALHNTPGAPMEYLGKALVYQAQNNFEEEIKCFELALRRYRSHPLIQVIHDQVNYRMHESAREVRRTAYHFVLLVVRYIPQVAILPQSQKLFARMRRHWDPLPFLETSQSKTPDDLYSRRHFSIQIAFWLAKPYFLGELLQEVLEETPEDLAAIGDALFSLIMLGPWPYTRSFVAKIRETRSREELQNLHETLELIDIAILCYERPPAEAAKALMGVLPKRLTHRQLRIAYLIMEEAIRNHVPKIVFELIHQLKTHSIPQDGRLLLASYEIWAHLSEKNLKDASRILHSFPTEELTRETSPLHFLYGCWLAASEGAEIAEVHFSGVLDTPYPRVWALTSHYLSGRLAKRWQKKAFLWEKRQLYRQLHLFYQCQENEDQAEKFRQLEREQYVQLSES